MKNPKDPTFLNNLIPYSARSDYSLKIFLQTVTTTYESSINAEKYHRLSSSVL